ncbi:MAG: MATE family efflux transporter [Chlamydiales bacterium]|nr:MATE family efflux transporter [Chlamydiales bacterium]
MTTHANYQLTSHPVGSSREIWSICWPLMLSFCSNSFMMFADRLFLAHHSVSAMNAMAVAANFCFLVLIFPFGICEITEVFVGRFHGEERHHDVGRPTWQIIWLSIASWPLFFIISHLFSTFLFAQDSLESTYLNTFLSFGPFLLVSLALTGFFVGIGNTRVITYATISANFVNLLLAPLLIFGTPLTPALGIKGAALAGGLSQTYQALYLFVLFLQKKRRDEFATKNCAIDLKLTKEMLKIGLPAGTSRSLEVLAHCAFFYIMAQAGPMELTIATIVQSFFLLVVFCNDATSKGVTAIISNLIGAGIHTLIPKVMQAAYRLQIVLFGLVCALCFVGADSLFSFVLQEQDKALLADASFVFTLKLCLLLMCLFFLFDGFWWIVIGHLTAIGDTKFILYANAIAQWCIYIAPTYALVMWADGGALCGWTMVTLNSAALFIIFLFRSRKQLNAALGTA